MAVCPQCGKANEAGARFCSACGSPLPEEAQRAEARKTVTVLFCDVTGSTALGERIDPEATRKLMAQYFETARTVLERHGASVEKFIGDAVMAVFGVPQVHEDDALRAVRAAAELRDAVSEVELRIGVNTGEVVTGGGETLVTGDAVNVAARLEQAAEPGEILLGETTRRLTAFAIESEPLEPLELKGKAERVPAHRLDGVLEGAPGFARRLDSPLVGRSGELEQLRHAYRRAVRERTCYLFTVLGSPGIGKSRLTGELLTGVRDEATILAGRCLPYGEGITYWPLVEIMRQLGGEQSIAEAVEDEAVLERIKPVVGASSSAASSEETFWAVRKLFEAVARRKPLVVLLDDLQWAEPTLLDLVEHVADWTSDAPLLLLCVARPELLDTRPGWSGGKLNATTILLEPLSEEEAETLMTNLTGRDELSAETRARIGEAAEGNPLFVEQMLAMLAEDGDVSVPPTIQALLAARLDRLPPPERGTLERASIIGKEFWRGAIAELGADPSVLPVLVRKEFVRPFPSVFAGDDGFRFRHLLVRDAAYDGMPKKLRAELHERFANWLEPRSAEYEEIVGYHLEQAFRYRSELGLVDEQARGLAARAGGLLATAGLRAGARADIPATINLLTRAVDLLPAGHPRRLELLPDLGYAHFEAGALDQADAVFGEAVEQAAVEDAPVVAGRAAVGRFSVGLMRGQSVAETREGFEDALAKLEELDDPLALAEAYREAGKREGFLGRTAAGDRYWQKGLSNAERSGSRRLESEILAWRSAMPCFGYLPAREGLRSTAEILAGHPGGMVEAYARAAHGRYRAITGDVEGGLAELADSMALGRDLGLRMHVTGGMMIKAYVDLDVGEAAAAETDMRTAHAILEEMGERGYLSTVASILACALYEQGSLDEAERFTHVSEEAGAEDDVLTQMKWRTTRAKVLARRGDLVAGEALAREAVAIAERTDYLEDHAYVLLDLAEVLAVAGRPQEGASPIEQAIRLFEQKENVFGVERARARLRELAGEPLSKLE